MLIVAIEAGVLMMLLNAFSGVDVDFLVAFGVALVAAVGTSVLAFGLAGAMGFFGVILAAILAAAGLGVAVSACFGADIKRSCLIGAIFVVVHVGLCIVF